MITLDNGKVAKSHGTPSAYNKGCHCPDCTEANRLRCIKYRSTEKGRERVNASGRASGKRTGHAAAKKFREKVKADPILRIKYRELNRRASLRYYYRKKAREAEEKREKDRARRLMIERPW